MSPDPRPATSSEPGSEPGAPEQEPSIEDPSRFPDSPEVQPLDEAPDGTTPSDTTDSDADSLPPGAPRP